jgi:hypothetical protein
MRKHLFYRENNGGSAAIGAFTIDAAESTWLAGDLEYIDSQVYQQPYVELQAMNFIPSKTDIPQWAQTYTWREMDGVGKAKILTSMSDDFPRSDVFKRETTKTIKMIGDSYGYSWDEMQAAASQPNGHLDADRAVFNRFSCEEKRDEVLAYGASAFGLQGLFTLTGTRTFTLGTKQSGGTQWGTLQAPKATGREVAYDLMGFAEDICDNSQGFIKSVNIILPIPAFGYAANKEMSATDNTKALTAALASPFINSIQPWYRASAANSNGLLGADTMIAYPMNPMFLCGINTMAYTIFPAQQVGLEWKIYAALKTGGVVCRHPFLVSYATGM